MAAFVAMTFSATCEAASGYSYFFTPRFGPIEESSSTAPVHHGYKYVAHPYSQPKKTHTYVQPKKSHTYVQPKKTHTYFHPKKFHNYVHTYAHPKKIYGHR